MFCQNCGKEIPDGVAFCPECGTKVEKAPAQETVAEEIPAQETIPAQNEEPAEERLILETKPIEAEPEQDAKPQDAVPAEAAPEAPATAAAGPETKGEKAGFLQKHKTLAIILAAVVVLLIVVAAFFKPLSNAVVKLFTSPAGYYHYVEKKYVKDTVKDIAESYALTRDAISDVDNMSVSGGMSLEFEGKGSSILDSIGEMIDVDLTWIKSLEFAGTESIKDKKTSSSGEFKVNGKSVLTSEIIADLSDFNLYARVPELNTEYILLGEEFFDELGIDLSEIADPENNTLDAVEKINNSLPAKAKLISVLNECFKTAVDQVQNVKQINSKNISAKGVKQNVTVLEVKIDEETVENIIVNVCEELKSNNDVKESIYSLAEAYNEYAGSDETGEEAYIAFTEALDDLIEDAPDFAEYYLDEYRIEYKVYVNKNGEVIGRKVEISEISGSFEYVNSIEYLLTKKGKEYGFELNIESKNNTKNSKEIICALESKGECKGDKYTGSVKVVSDENDLDLDFDIKNLDFTKVWSGSISGNVVIPVDDSAISDVFGYSAAMAVSGLVGKNLSLDIDFNIADSKSDFAVTLYTRDTKVATIKYNAKKTNASKISVPSEKKSFEITDSDDLLDWLLDIDFSGISKKLDKAGASADVLDLIDDLQDTIDDLNKWR